MWKPWVLSGAMALACVGCASEEQLGTLPASTFPVCGDGMLSPGEVCPADQPGPTGPLGCPEDTPVTCGNGVIDLGEMCDQGNAAQGIPQALGSSDCATYRPNTVGALQCECCSVDTALCTPMVPVGGTAG